MVATVGAYAYTINRNTQKDTEEKIEKTRKELKEEITAKTSVERQLSSQEIKRLESEVQSVKIDVHAVSTLISNHIQYSRENHPTNQTVFPVLEGIQSQIQKLSEKFDHEKEEEVRDLKRQLEDAKRKSAT